MDRKKSERLQYILILVLGLVIAGLLVYMIPYRYRLNVEAHYEMDPTIVDNPLMGFAPRADNEEYCKEANLVYINLTWAEWEPERGVYDIDGLEDSYNIAKWKEEKKHAILRFVCDIPSENEHIDIPTWLYERTGDGVSYDNPYGKGYCPNYDNPVFIELHNQALQALAEYCKKDDFVTFVELGSLGHWGEWHALVNGQNAMPGAETCLTYATQYSDSFTDQLLLTRRNYDFSTDNGMGVFNDMVGDIDDTDEWLDWTKSEQIQETMGEPLVLKPVKELGMHSPVGGEFTSGIPMEDILGDDLGDVLAQISDSHMTFIGPMVPDLTAEENQVDLTSILRRMGYRIYVSKLETQYDFSKNSMRVDLTFKNEGYAGFFFSWPATVYVYDGEKNLVFCQKLDFDLKDLNGGEEKTVSAMVPYSDEISNEFYLGVDIHDYQSDEYINMAIKMEEDLGWIDESRIIYHYIR